MGLPWTPEEGDGFLGAGVTGSCEPPNLGAGIQTRVPWKISKHSKLLNFLFNLSGNNIYMSFSHFTGKGKHNKVYTLKIICWLGGGGTRL